MAVGTRIGSYEITAPIGQGGMGAVFRARDTQLNRDVAIKLMRDPFAADHDRLARFEREAQVLAALNHPNIAQVHGLEVRDLPGTEGAQSPFWSEDSTNLVYGAHGRLWRVPVPEARRR